MNMMYKRLMVRFCIISLLCNYMVKGLTKWQIPNAKPLSLQQPDVHQEAQSGQSSPLAELRRLL